jgi:hypothetical protein
MESSLQNPALVAAKTAAKAKTIVYWIVTTLLSRRDASDFVPKGLDDRSQAIYCLEYAQKRRTVPEGRWELGYTTYSPPMAEERPVDRIIPFPTGRVLCVAHSRQ